jgi:hypothetical protein
VLLLGTTGEGPSFSDTEKVELWKTALSIRKSHPKFRLLAGTGTPSLDETIDLTRTAFDLGMDGVVVLPPYFYRNASEEGLFTWYTGADEGPAADSFIYHIPRLGCFTDSDLFVRLKDAYPERSAGLRIYPAARTFPALQKSSQRFQIIGNDRLSALRCGTRPAAVSPTWQISAPRTCAWYGMLSKGTRKIRKPRCDWTPFVR